MGKAEGEGAEWHGHVTAVTVAPDFRKIGLATVLMDLLESVSEHKYKGYFVDLYVRKSNDVAVKMYERFGYALYRTVAGYYSDPQGDEDGYDMRKSLSRDVNKRSMMYVRGAKCPLAVRRVAACLSGSPSLTYAFILCLNELQN